MFMGNKKNNTEDKIKYFEEIEKVSRVIAKRLLEKSTSLSAEESYILAEDIMKMKINAFGNVEFDNSNLKQKDRNEILKQADFTECEITEKFDLTPESKFEKFVLPRVDEIAKLVQQGATIHQIAILFDTTPEQLQKMALKYPVFRKALNVARVTSTLNLRSNLFKVAQGYTKTTEEYGVHPETDQLILIKVKKEELPPDVRANEILINSIEKQNDKTNSGNNELKIKFAGIERPSEEDIENEKRVGMRTRN